MNLFTYNPVPYVDTQIDLPLDFIQGQLETKQKEFDAQNAAIDKATENFLKLNYGRLTKEQYDTIMQKYLPQIEKIRDDLVNTGNVSMAAPELSRFTTSLAADPDVKNIMQDYELTQAYNKGLQEGRYTDKIFAGLFDKEGKPRPQLRPGELTSAQYYAPMQYTDPIKDLAPEAKEYKANIIEDIKTNPTKYGLFQTDSQTVEQVAQGELQKYLRDRLSTWKQHPENQAYFWSATGYQPQTYTSDMWEKDVVTPLSEAFSYKKITKDRSFQQIPEVKPPSRPPSKQDGGGDAPAEKKKEIKSGLSVALQGRVTGIPSIRQNFYENNEIGDFNQLLEDKDFGNKSVQDATDQIARLTRIISPNLVTYNNWDNRKLVADNISKNYTQNEYGQWILKPGSTAPPVTPEISQALTDFNEYRYQSNTRENLINDLKKDVGVKDFDPNVIKAAEAEAERRYRVEIDNKNIITMSDDEVKEWKKNIIKEQLKDKPEGKIYKAFDNLKTKMAQIQLSYLPENEFNQHEQSLINLAVNGSLTNLKNLVSNADASKEDGLKEFIKSLPTDDKGDIDYSGIQSAIGYDPDDGVVGVFAFNGKYYQFDLSETNIDKLATDQYPMLKAQMRFWQDVSTSLKRSGNTKGSFKIGNTDFNFDAKFKNLGTDNPEFRYEYSLDGINIQSANNLGDIFTQASDHVSNSLQNLSDIEELLIEELDRQYYERYDQLNENDYTGLRDLNDWYKESVRRIQTNTQTQATQKKVIKSPSSIKTNQGLGKPTEWGTKSSYNPLQ
jgi:hypothetical protein